MITVDGRHYGTATEIAERGGLKGRTMTPEQRIRATHALDNLDAATVELSHWLETGERVVCPRCDQKVPAGSDHAPVRHHATPALLVDRRTVVQQGDWCEGLT